MVLYLIVIVSKRMPIDAPKTGIQLRHSRLLNQLLRISNRPVITDNNIIDLNLTESPYSTHAIYFVIIFRWCSSFAAFFTILATYSSISKIQAKSDGEILIKRSVVKPYSIKSAFRPSATDISLISSHLRLKVKIMALIIQRS